ncbi:MAG TPA: trypsin-like peptidase domain-containing protein [Candidatus Pacearchaeota archaeon]|nr:trypsin-like peptidase domain-containing protein [Candidatus Pacearchaeota archaeon]
MYQLPEFNFKKIQKPEELKFLPKVKSFDSRFLVFFLLGVLVGLFFTYYLYSDLRNQILKAGVPLVTQEKIVEKEYVPQTTEEDKVINVVKSASPSVVSIVITKEVPIYSAYDWFWGVPQSQGTEKQQVGAGSGFIVSSDGMVLTNKHVVSDTKAEYTVITNDDKEYEALVLARDPVQDIAILKIQSNDSFSPIKLGSSENIQIGQTSIAIGNALGQLKNTVSVGVISGLERTVTATGGTTTETLEDIIQTDAAINSGNSGGPLLNLMGEVIGINTAVASSAENIGFAIPIDRAIKDIEKLKTTGKISYPFIGIRYVAISEDIMKELDLPVSYGILIVKGDLAGEKAISSGSPAEKAGLKEDDIVLEFNGEKITEDNSLSKIMLKYNPGDTVSLKILRNKQELIKNIVLGERE